MKVEFDLSKMKFVKGSLQNKIMRIAINKAAAPVKAAVIAQSPTMKGNLKKSIKIKSKHYKAKNIWTAIVGPSSSFTRKGKTIKAGPKKGQKPVIRPAKYAPAVEKKKRFLKSSLQASAGQFRQTLQEAVRQQLEAILNQK